MKFHEFIFIFKCKNLHYETNIFEEIMNLPNWIFLKEWYDNLHALIITNDREKTDYELSPNLCIEAFSKSQMKYYLTEETYLTLCHPEYPEPTKPFQILTALEVYLRYGGSCMALVLEKTKCQVRNYEKI